MFLMTSSTYAADRWSIWRLFDFIMPGAATENTMPILSPWEYRLNWENIKDGTVTSYELADEIEIDSLKINKLNSISWDIEVNSQMLLSALPTSDDHIANKYYVDNALNWVRDSLIDILDVLQRLATIITITTDTNDRVKELETKISNLESGGFSNWGLLQEWTYYFNWWSSYFCKKKIITSWGSSRDNNINFTKDCWAWKKCDNNWSCIENPDTFNLMLTSNGWTKEWEWWVKTDWPVDIYVKEWSPVPGTSNYRLWEILIKRGGEEFRLSVNGNGFRRIWSLMWFGWCIEDGYYPAQNGTTLEFSDGEWKDWRWCSLWCWRSSGWTCSY